MYKLLALFAVVAALAAPAAGQGAAVSCTASLITSFTPCFNFLTNSSNGSPTADCCRSLGALVNASTGCACLILTGNVPLGLGVPINRTLAVTLPKACNSMSVPLQCRDTSAQIPAPGPVADAPASAPLPPATPEPEAPVKPTEPAAPAPVSQGQTRPIVMPSSSAWRGSSHVSMASAFVQLLAVGAALV